MWITKFILKRPVTAVLCLLSIVFFGLVCIFRFKIELTPEMSMPMYIVQTTYNGASPEVVDKNLTKPIEAELYNLTGVKNVECSSSENVSVIAIEYNYTQNMDEAYNDLKKSVDFVKNSLDDSIKDAISEPNIIEMDMNSMPSIKLAVQNKSTTDIYNYVTNTFVKEMEKISDVADVSVSGGQEDYIRIEINPNEIKKYNLNLADVASCILNADFSTPAGNLTVGNSKLSVSTGVDHNTIMSLKNIPIVTGNKTTVYLEDIASIYETKKDLSEIGRYDGVDCMIVSLTKAQTSTAVSLSNKVKSKIKQIEKNNPNVIISIISDSADSINSSIQSVFETMVIAIILSMLIIFIFVGDLKASLIVGTSIPFSIITSFIGLYGAGFSLNIITCSALVLGVGMMVDNSIVVLEACFRTKEQFTGNDVDNYIKTVVNATKNIGLSVFGSTLTTIVVFLPLAFLSGMAGQYFKPLGFTIVFCMLASYTSSITVVPLCFVVFKPEEKTKSLAGELVRFLQDEYVILVNKFLKHKKLVIGISVIILVISYSLCRTFSTELMTESDEGMIEIEITTKPSLVIEEKDKIYKKFEEFVKSKSEVKHYVISSSGNGMSSSGSDTQSIIVTLVDEKIRKKKTKVIANEWKKELSDIVDCSIDVSSYQTSMSSGMVGPGVGSMEVYIVSSDYDKLKEVNDKIKKILEERNDISNVQTSLDNAAPMVKISVDEIIAKSEGISPQTIGNIVYQALSGIDIMDMTIGDETYDVILEYPKNEYNDIVKLENIKIQNGKNQTLLLKDIAKIEFKDSPKTISKYNKKYRSKITLNFNNSANMMINMQVMQEVIMPNLTNDVTMGNSALDENINEEFSSLFITIGVAIFLVFFVMACQFESIKYSLMVMATILFSFVGSFVALWISDLKLSMTVLLGLLMLVGTAVNNGILYVDTVNQLKENTEFDIAIVDAGKIRLRPIFMTTLTTIVSMIPMSIAYGNNGEMLQGLAVCNIGGLITSTIMALLVLPLIYQIFSKNDINKKESLGQRAIKVLRYGEMYGRE